MASTDGTRPIAFILGRCWNLAAVQVGMLRALTRHDIRPAMVVGSSLGALNGAAFAEHPTLAGLARLRHIWGLMDGTTLDRGEHLQDLVRQTMRTATFEKLPVPFHCVARDVVDGSERWFDRGPLVDAVLASAARPEIIPGVEIDGRRYANDAITDDALARRAVELGARSLYLLTALEPDGRGGPSTRTDPWSALDAELDDVELHVMPTGLPSSPQHTDIIQNAELVRSADLASEALLHQIGLAHRTIP